jgi:hypothetical protein
LLAEISAAVILLSNRESIQTSHAWTWVGCGRAWSANVTAWPPIVSAIALGLAMKADPYTRGLDRAATAARIAAAIILVASVVFLVSSLVPQCIA